MALDHKSNHEGKTYAVGELLSNQAANTNGLWHPLGGLQPISVTFENTVGSPFVGTVRLHVSNANAQPAEADVGALIGESITSLPECLQFTQSWRWIKASVSGYTSGTLKAVGLWAGPGA